MPALSPEVSRLLLAIKGAIKPSEADSERVLDTLRARLGDLDEDTPAGSHLSAAIANDASDAIP